MKKRLFKILMSFMLIIPLLNGLTFRSPVYAIDEFEQAVSDIASETQGKKYNSFVSSKKVSWCGYYVQYVLREAYERIGYDYKGYIPSSLLSANRSSNDFQDHQYGGFYAWDTFSYGKYNTYETSNTADYFPKIGDVIFVDFDGKEVDHIGLIVGYNSDGSFISSEGNTGSGTRTTRVVRYHKYEKGDDGLYHRSGGYGTVKSIGRPIDPTQNQVQEPQAQAPSSVSISFDKSEVYVYENATLSISCDQPDCTYTLYYDYNGKTYNIPVQNGSKIVSNGVPAVFNMYVVATNNQGSATSNTIQLKVMSKVNAPTSLTLNCSNTSPAVNEQSNFSCSCDVEGCTYTYHINHLTSGKSVDLPANSENQELHGSFNVPGQFTVYATATNEKGSIDSNKVSVDVSSPVKEPTEATITLSSDKIVEGETFTIDMQCDQPDCTYTLSFTDNNGKTQEYTLDKGVNSIKCYSRKISHYTLRAKAENSAGYVYSNIEEFDILPDPSSDGFNFMSFNNLGMTAIRKSLASNGDSNAIQIESQSTSNNNSSIENSGEIFEGDSNNYESRDNYDTQGNGASLSVDNSTAKKNTINNNNKVKTTVKKVVNKDEKFSKPVSEDEIEDDKYQEETKTITPTVPQTVKPVVPEKSVYPGTNPEKNNSKIDIDLNASLQEIAKQYNEQTGEQAIVSRIKFGSYVIDFATENSSDSITMDVLPVAKNGRTMLPARYVASSLGLNSTWDQKTKTAYFSDDKFILKVPVKTNRIYCNGYEFTTDSAPLVKNQRIYLSISNIVKTMNLTFGKNIFWNQATKEVTIIR